MTEQEKFRLRLEKEKAQEEKRFTARLQKEREHENKSPSAYHTFQKGVVSGLAASAPVAAGAYMGAKLGMPFGPWGAVVGAAGGGIAGSPAGQPIKDWLSNIDVGGVPLTYGSVSDLPQPERPTARAGEVVGGSLPFISAPFALAGKIPPPNAPKHIFSPIAEQIRREPGKVLALESGLTAGAAQGAALAELLDPGDPTTATAAEVAGGFVNPTGAIARATGKVASSARNVVRSMSPSGRTERTAELLQKSLIDAGEDPKKIAELLRNDDVPSVDISAGMKSESPTLLALEEKLASSNPEFGADIKGRVIGSKDQLSSLIRKMSESSNPDLLQTAARLEKFRFEKALNARMDVARERLEKSTSALSGDEAASSSRATRIIESAMSDARKVEAELWSRTPKKIWMSGENIINGHKSLLDERLREDPLPPSFVGAFVRRVSKEGGLTSGEVQKFRSTMLKKAGEARSKKEWDSARQYEDMAEAALKDLETMDDAAGASARAWSRGLHDAFTRTFAGDALSVRGTGARRIPPESVLRRAYGSGGALANVRLKELSDAAGYKMTGSGMMTDQEEFLRHVSSSVIDPNTGRVNQRALEKFAAENEQMLSRFPGLRKDLSTVLSAERTLAGAESARKVAAQSVERRAAFARVLNYENPAEAVKSALSSKTPERDYMALVRLAKRGGADEGLRAATVDYATRAATDSSGNFSFARFNEVMTRPMSKNGPSLIQIMGVNKILKPTEVVRMNKIISEAQKIERGLESVARMNELPESTPDAIYDLAIRAVGANIGGLAGGGSGAPIVMAGAGSRFGRNLFEKVPTTRIMDVIIEASKNPKFMASLLEKPKTFKQAKQLDKQINAFLIQAGLVPDEPEQ